MNKKPIIILGTIIVGILVTATAVFVVQTYRSRAEEVTAIPLFIHTQRVSGTVGTVQFETNIAATAALKCATEKNGDYVLCGSETEPTTSHDISTKDSGLLLNPSTGYYVKIILGQSESLAYIFGDGQGVTFGTSFDAFNSVSVGSCRPDGDFDPAFDFNQDGCVNLVDAAETINP